MILSIVIIYCLIIVVIISGSLPNEKINLVRKEFYLTTLSSALLTLVSIIIAYLFTVHYENEKNKEKLEGMLKSAIYSTETAISNTNMQLENFYRYINILNGNNEYNEYGDGIKEEFFALYEPIAYIDVLPTILENGDMFFLLSTDSQYLLPQYIMNSTSIMESYNYETNSYYNLLLLKHLKNTLTSQKNHLINELNYLEDNIVHKKNEKESEEIYQNFDDFTAKDYICINNKAIEEEDKSIKSFSCNPFMEERLNYEERWQEIEGEWIEYTKKLNSKLPEELSDPANWEVSEDEDTIDLNINF